MISINDIKKTTFSKTNILIFNSFVNNLNTIKLFEINTKKLFNVCFKLSIAIFSEKKINEIFLKNKTLFSLFNFTIKLFKNLLILFLMFFINANAFVFVLLNKLTTLNIKFN